MQQHRHLAHFHNERHQPGYCISRMQAWTSTYGVIPPIDYNPTEDEAKEIDSEVLQKVKDFVQRRFLKRLPQEMQPVPEVHIIKV